MRRFCYRCEHDKDFKNPCEIIILTMGYDLTDKEYPKEWVLENNEPRCIKFKKATSQNKGA